ncbi:MAG TPA: FtsX-like permease family protein [Thermoanaerobaculia bacterium]|nr:FtsX-like permease family protein [Thermoanaerobaculia bacterium]
MYARLLIESLRRGTRRKLLAVTAVALGTLGATALGEVMLASGDRLAAELASYGANLELVPGPGQATLAVARLPLVRRIFWRNNIAAMAPLYPLRLRLAVERGSEARSAASMPVIAEVVGTWFHHSLESALEPEWRTGLPATRPTLRVAGRWPRDESAAEAGAADLADLRPAEAVLGRRLAARLHLGIGGHLRASLGARSVPLAVTGIVTSGGEEDDQAFVPLAVVGGLAGQPGRFLRAEIFAQTNPESRNVRDPRGMTPREYETWYCTAYPSSVAFQLHQALPEAEARVVYGVTAATAAVLGKLRGVLLALAVVALVGAAVGVTAAMTATVLERRLEAGLMVAIGAARRRVVLFFLLEAALLGGLGGLLGGGLGLVAGRLLGAGALGVQVPWKPVLLPFAVLLGLVVAVLASAPPVSRALGRYPAALLKRATA